MSIKQMRAVQVHAYGAADQLKLEDVQRPEPQAGEVLVKVQAAGVNPIDWKVRQGLRKHMLAMQFPYIPGMELAGVVEEVGSGVTSLKIGQEVYGRSTTGAYAEYAVASAGALGSKPQHLSFDQAAAVPVGATAAWQGLFEMGKLEAGQRVLIQGASGGIGLFAVQFAKWKGAQVFATASGANLEAVRALGADTVIDYTTTALADVVQDVDLTFDIVGEPTVETSVQATRRGGTLVVLGAQPDAAHVQEREIHVALVRTQIESNLLGTFARMLDDGQLQVTVKKVFPFSQVRQAHLLSEQGGQGSGRIVLHIAEPQQ